MSYVTLSPGTALRALRPTHGYTCAVCGAPFTASDSRATYCSNRCCQAAKYQRRKAARRASPTASDRPDFVARWLDASHT